MAIPYVSDFVDKTQSVLSGGADKANEVQLATAQAQSEAAIKEAKKQRAFMLEQAAQGRKDIDLGLSQGVGQLGLYDTLAGNALGIGQAEHLGGLTAGQQRLMDLYGGGLAENYYQSPDLAHRQKAGEQSIMRGASARGGRHGSGTMMDLINMSQGLASEDFNNYANRQLALANQASGMDIQRGGMGGQMGSQLAQLYSGMGTNSANVLNTQGNAKANVNMGLAGQNTALTGATMQNYFAPVQYAGAAQAARANMYGNMMNQGAQAAGYIYGANASPSGTAS